MERLKLEINKTKSKCVIFERARHALHDDEIKLFNDECEIVNHYKYVGHIIQRNLLDTLDVDHRLNKFYSQFNYVFRNSKNVSHDTLLHLFI